MASFVQNEITGTETRHGDKAVGTGIAQSHKQVGTDDATDPRLENSTNLTGEMMSDQPVHRFALGRHGPAFGT